MEPKQKTALAVAPPDADPEGLPHTFFRARLERLQALYEARVAAEKESTAVILALLGDQPEMRIPAARLAKVVRGTGLDVEFATGDVIVVAVPPGPDEAAS